MVHWVDVTAEVGCVCLSDVVEDTCHDGGAERTAEACAYETYDAHGFEVVFERDAAGKGVGERSVHNAHTGTLEKHRQIEHVFLGGGVDEKIEHDLIEQEGDKAGENDVLDAPFPSGEGKEEYARTDGNAGGNAPVEVGVVAGVVAEDGTCGDVLCRCGCGRHKGHASEEKEDVEHVVLREGPYVDVWMPYGGGTLQTHGEQYDGKDDGGAYLFAVEPVVVFAINADENDAEQPECPEYAAEIVDAFEGNVRTLAEVVAHAEIYKGEYENERSYGDAVHGLPVEGVYAIAGGYVDELHAAENKREEEREEHGKISFGCYLELNVAPAYECSDNLEEAAGKGE